LDRVAPLAGGDPADELVVALGEESALQAHSAAHTMTMAKIEAVRLQSDVEQSSALLNVLSMPPAVFDLSIPVPPSKAVL